MMIYFFFWKRAFHKLREREEIFDVFNLILEDSLLQKASTGVDGLLRTRGSLVRILRDDLLRW